MLSVRAPQPITVSITSIMVVVRKMLDSIDPMDAFLIAKAKAIAPLQTVMETQIINNKIIIIIFVNGRHSSYKQNFSLFPVEPGVPNSFNC